MRTEKCYKCSGVGDLGSFQIAKNQMCIIQCFVCLGEKRLPLGTKKKAKLIIKAQEKRHAENK